jgi:flagellar export protein FliJ
MSGFVFTLQPLLNYRQGRRDLCRQLLAQIADDDRALAAKRDALADDRRRQLDQLRDLSQTGRVSIDGAAARRYYSGQLLAAMQGLDRQRALVAQQMELCRKALVQADVECKVLQRLEEKQRAAWRYAAERRAQHEREDLWTARRLAEAAR